MQKMFFHGLSDWLYSKEKGLELGYAKKRYLVKNCFFKVKGKVVGEVQYLFKLDAMGMPFYGYVVDVWDNHFLNDECLTASMLDGAPVVDAEIQGFDNEECIVVYQIELCTTQSLLVEMEAVIAWASKQA